MRMEKK